MSSRVLPLQPSERNRELDRLLEQVLQRHLQIEDRFEIAAILESMGLNDIRAREQYGVSDVFELAEELWERSRKKVTVSPFTEVERIKLGKLIVELTRNFLRGAIFALPMAVSVVSMLTLKFSLWSYENLSVELATSIAIGTILSFVTVGGFTQAIARRGFFYIIQGYYNMARKVTFYFIAMGFLVCLCVSAAIYGINLIIQMFPFNMLSVVILFFFFLNTIWLSVTVMYILRKELVFTGLIIVGIGIVYLFFVVLAWDIIVSQLIALFMVSIMSILLVLYYFKEAEKKAEKGIEPKMPKMSVTIYSTMPYFVYGFLYFTFLFVDRIMAWSTNTDYMPYIIFFRGEYELGLDFALLVLIIPMGISEVVLSKLMMDIEVSQKSYWGDETRKMNQTYVQVYYRRLIVIAVISAATAFFLYYFTRWFFSRVDIEIGRLLFEGSISHFVFLWALIGYVFISTALMNAVILFSLSQPEKVTNAILPSLAVNMLVGFLLSRWIGYEFAVFGLVAGAIVFVVWSTTNVVGVLKKLDYYLYAAS